MVRQLPEDPMVRNIIQMMRGRQLTRRNILKGGAVAAAGVGALSMTACGGGETVDKGDGSAGKFVWGNWPYYLDFDENGVNSPTLDAFMAQTNIEVTYIQDIDDNNTFYGKIKDQLELGQHTGYDVITFTDWMNGRLIEAGQVQELDHSNLANVTANLVDSEWDALKADEGRHFTVPWQLPASGFVWNTAEVPNGIKTLDDFMSPELKGKVVVLSEMRDTMGLILAGLGYDPAGDWGDKEWGEAMQWLDDGLKSGQIGNVKGNSYDEDLISGTALAAMAWTGDVVSMNAENGDQWTIEVPEAGGMIASDSFAVPNGTGEAEKGLVEEMINYYYEPEVAAEVANYVSFVTPVKGAQEAMETVNPDNVDNPLIFPSDEDWKRLHHFRALSPADENKYQSEFQSVLGL